VEEDEAPTLHITPLGGTAIANGSTTSDLMMGLEYTFHIVAHDSNGLDSLTITPVPASHDDDCSGEECLPPTATLSETQHSVGADGAAHATRTLTFAPKHDHGGYMMTHCFSVSDSCGTACGHDTCPGSIDVVTHCVTFKVKRCEMVVREGHQLQQIAAIYRSDWLQLWSHNQDMMHPDMGLNPQNVLNIGHLYDVQPFDKPADVAKRFGMDKPALKTLNADVDVDADMLCDSVVACTGVQMCIMPNSCTGASSSIYHNALAPDGASWFAGTRAATPAV
jgi:hypothetical protein